MTPPDQSARDRIRTDLAANLFIEAGAGAGKTTSLVGRIIGLVDSGVEIGAIAAITFTEKAAAELRHRLRIDLVAAGDAAESERAARFDAALDGLDHAPIGTLHAFARRLLNDYPVQGGLPPGFTVLDELESHLAFEERWEALLDRVLDDPAPPGGVVDGGSELIELCSLDRFRIDRGGRRVAVGFHENWDLVVDRVDRSDPPPWHLDTEPFVREVLAVCETRCPPGDDQAERLAELREVATGLQVGPPLGDRIALLERLEDRCRRVKRLGAKKNWKEAGLDPTELDDLRARELALAERASELLQAVRARRVRVLGTLIGRWVLESAQARAADGTVEFHDLLVLARRLVTDHAEVRTELHRRYQRVLLDEFQDTDPIQLEIAVRLTAAPDDPAQNGDWTALRPLPGRLFIVGDPKQSIYRFRRADIAQYMRAAEQVGADTEVLSANFRSALPILDWINHVFEPLIERRADVQPGYQALDACRPHDLGHGSVTVLGVDEHADLPSGKRAEELRWREAGDAADAVATALNEAWPVTDEGGGQLRPCRPGDITILLPARTSLAALEAALRERDIPYRAENSSVVYTTFEIRHLMLALRAVDDATDQLALVAALRSPLYGCSDVELYEWKAAGGVWSIWWEPPAELDGHPVAEALDHLRRLAERSTWLTPADVLAALVDERRVLDAALDGLDARDVWRRVRYVIDQARAWSDAGGHGLRRYLAWVRLLASESRNADTVLPEHDDDAVRIMTVHAAKGLEFPITVLSGLTTKPLPAYANSVVWHEGGWTISTKHSDEIYDDYKPLDEQMSDAERRRLLYVACTRAIDHLVVSLHRLPGGSSIGPTSTNACLLHAAGADAGGARPLRSNPGVHSPAREPAGDLPWADRDAWADERSTAFRRAARRDAVSATELARSISAATDDERLVDAGLDKEPVDLDLPPWQRGRYGTAVGRAVHAVLQFADLRTGGDIDDHAAAQCAAEGILGMDATVAALARSALDAPIVRAALDVPHHRELFVATEIGDRVLEGYIDLFVETDDGGVIVDYKTDQWPDDAERSNRIERYRRQLAAYGVALEQILGRPIAGGVLVRCRPDGPAEEIPIDDWSAAVEEARSTAASP
jgi:ATP-dependent helicase/nuclease subunit A